MKRTNKCAIFRIFLQKILKEYKFSWIFKICFLVLIPIGLIIANLKISHNKSIIEETIFEALDEQSIVRYFPSSRETKIYFYPETNFTIDLIEELRVNHLGVIYESVSGFNSLSDLDSAIVNSPAKLLFAIIFDESGNENRRLKYTIRARNRANIPTDAIFRNTYNELNSRDTDEYINSGILAMQVAINEIYMSHQNVTPTTVTFEHFPTNELAATTNMDIVSFANLLMMFCCLNVINTVLIPMVDEKESGVRNLLRIATRLFYFNEVARLLVNFMFFLLFVSIIFAIVQFYVLWGSVTAAFPYFLTIFFILALIPQTIALSLIFKRVEYCKIAGILFYIIPYLILEYIDDEWFLKKLDCVSPLNLFVNGMKIIKEHVLTERNINIYMENEVPLASAGDILKPHLFTIYFILLMNAVGYLVIYLLLKNVDSRESLQKTTDKLVRKCCRSRVNNAEEGLAMAPPENAIVYVQRAVKRFHSCKTTKEAVRGVDLDVMHNEITVLLGHNGAGKTTLISMITGILHPNSGKIWVNGLSNPREYEQYIGYCPQKNVFIKQFNCFEHVKFFGRLRGVPADQIQEEAEKVLNQVKLLPYASQTPYELSGGMKRRLCLAISIIGNTRVVILDEPTSGLDPRSRRDLWDILLQLKHEKAILLTTHYMEEADILGETIAIMEAGDIVAKGTPLELKKLYTSGYILKIVTDPHFKEDETRSLLNTEAPSYTLKSEIHPTMSFNIPYDLQPKYSTILRTLETNKKKLKINSVSITNPPLEDVFLRCSSMPNGDEDCVDGPREYSVIDAEKIYAGNCMSLLLYQVSGIFYKKLIHLRREFFYFLLLVSMPFIGLYLAQLLIHLSLNEVEQNSLQFTFSNPRPGDSIIVVMNKLEDIREQNKIKDLFQREAPGITFEFLTNTDLEFILKEKQYEDLHFYNEKILAGVEMDFVKREMKIMFSGNYYHGTVRTYTLASNVLVNYYSGHSLPPGIIETWTKPILRKTEDVGRGHVYIFETLVPMGFFLYILFYVSDPFNDISTQFKSLFCLSPKVYWIVSFLSDLCVHGCVIVVFTYVSYYGSFVDLFDWGTYVSLGCVYFVYAIPTLSLLYTLSRYIRTQENLFAVMFYLAMTGVVLSQIFSSTDEKIRQYAIESRFLLVLPDFGLRHAMSLTIFDYFTRLKYNGLRNDYYDVTWFYAISILVAVLLLLWLINVSENMYIVEHLRVPKCGGKKSKAMVQSASHDFPDSVDLKVRMEKEETQNLYRSDSDSGTRLEYPVIVINLKKVYDDNYAVKDLCFRVKKGECFGLLGTNGAGKTSTLEMMTLNRSLTEGAILLNNINCRSEEDKYRRTFGYCPQIDALNPSMTAYETIKYMALIKGVTHVVAETNEWLKKCDLEEYRNIPVGHYSGGTKRKLNTAIAMIGSPPVIFLDEPTTGIDPVSRRKIWRCIKELIAAGRTIILTSHSLDECEQLCNRIGIMYHGQLQCIGVTQELKNTLGDGYTLIIKLTESMGNQQIVQLKDKLKECRYDPSGHPEVEALKSNLNVLIEGAIEKVEASMLELGMQYSSKDHHGSILKYRVDQRDIVWSNVFDALMNLKQSNIELISDYSVNEVSLEDIFLQIGKQRDSTPTSV